MTDNDRRKSLSRRITRIAIATAIALVCWSILAPWLGPLLIVERAVDRPDAIVVLGGGAAYPERTRLAAELFKTGAAPRVVLTNDGLRGGWDSAEQRNPYFWEFAKRGLIANGVPESAITVLPEVVESTRDEACLIAREAAKLGWSRILIVTSPHHTRRALRAFERAGAGRIEYGIASPPSELGSLWWLSRQGLSRIGLEYVKLAWYSVSF